MAWKFTNDKPIFVQIVDILKKDIVSGKFQMGEKLPTVRDLSITAGVNPNTVQRAYTEIELMGLIYTKRGDGRYVCDDMNLIKSEAENELRENVNKFIKTVRELGFTDEQILTEINLELSKGKNDE